MLRKIIQSVLALFGVYFAYCAVRGAVYGVNHQSQMPDDVAKKIATFRG